MAAQRIGCGLHERAMCGDAHRQGHDLAGAAAVKRFHGCFHAGAVAGDDELPGAIVVRHLHDAARRRNLGAEFGDALRPGPGRQPSCPERAFRLPS